MKKLILTLPLILLTIASCNLDSDQGLLQEAVTAPDPITEVINGVLGYNPNLQINEGDEPGVLFVGTQFGIYTVNYQGKLTRRGLSGIIAENTLFADENGAVYFENSFDPQSNNEKYVVSKLYRTSYDGTRSELVGVAPEDQVFVSKYSSNGKSVTVIMKDRVNVASNSNQNPKYYAYYFENNPGSSGNNISFDSPVFESEWPISIIGDNYYYITVTPEMGPTTNPIGMSTYLYSTEAGEKPVESLSGLTGNTNNNSYPIVGALNGYVIIRNGSVFLDDTKILSTSSYSASLRVPVTQYDEEGNILFLFPNSTSFFYSKADDEGNKTIVSNPVNAIRTTIPYSFVGKTSDNTTMAFLIATQNNGLMVLRANEDFSAPTYEILENSGYILSDFME